MLESELKIGMKVEIATNSEFYGDWREAVCTVVGLSKRTSDKKMNVTIEDEGGMCFDGWGAEELRELTDGN